MAADPLFSGPRFLRSLWLLAASLVALLPACGDLDTPAFVDCAIAPDTLDFGGVTTGNSVDRTFTVTNGGSKALEGTIGSTCSDVAVVGSSSVSIARGATGTFTLRFTPSTAGSRTCRVSIADCGTLTVRGEGLAGNAECAVSPTSLSFGTVALGSSDERSFTITNTGNARLTGTVTESCAEFSLVGGGDYDLAPTEAATFGVRFAPTSGGIKSCTFDTGGLCANVGVSGTGQAPQADPQCAVSTDSLLFGTVAVGQSATRTFTITNTGGGTLSGTVSESCASFTIVGTTTYSLGAGQSATFTVRFSPAGEGVRTCEIDAGGGCDPLTARGIGQAQQADPLCVVSTDSLLFGTVVVGQNVTRTFTITNTGGGTSSGTVSESCADFSIVGTATYSLGGGQSATFTVRFAPSSEGVQTCAISTGGGCDPVSARGIGENVAASCQVDTTTFDFRDVVVGQSVDRKVTITNGGLGILSGTLTESCGDFSIVGTAAYSLGAVQSATFTLRFTPSATGSAECTVNAGTSCGNITLRGRGVPPPECELSAQSFDFGTVDVGKHEDHNFDIRNVGGGQLCGTATESCEGFAIQSGATYCAIPGTPFRLRIRFQPPRAGSFECTVDPGAGCPAITVRGVGR